MNTLSDRRTFDFITHASSDPESLTIDALRKEIDSIMAQRTDEDQQEDEVDNEVFRKQYIPQTLDEVYDAERDAKTLHQQGRDALVYKDLLAPTKGEGAVPEQEVQDEGGVSLHANGSDASDAASNEDTDDDNSEDSEPGRPRGKRFQDKDEKKAHKEQVKAEKREKRATKMPKAEKKRLIKGSGKRKH